MNTRRFDGWIANGLSRRAALRRLLVAGGGASLAGGLFLPGARGGFAQGGGTVRIGDAGGPYTMGWGKAYHEPFREETGINSIQIARQHEPIAEIKAQVEARNITWDATILSNSAHIVVSEQGLLEPLNLDPEECHLNELMPGMVLPDWVGIDIVASVFAYRADMFEESAAPRTWADFYDVEKFPGRRGMYQSPYDTLEQALLADGVPPAELYPLDLDRAFARLDTIKPHAIWFTGGAQATQMLSSGEAALVGTWNGRAQAAIDQGAPAKIVWTDWLATLDGISILKGSPNADNARKFICMMTRPDLMAVWTEYLAYGPTNPRAYEFIPPERAAVLPGSPDNEQEMIIADAKWRADHTQEMLDRFNAWVAS